MMRWHVLDRQNPRRIFQPGVDHALPVDVFGRAGFRSDLEHQVGKHFEVGEQRLPKQRFGDIRRIAVGGLFVGKARVRGPELDVGHDAVIVPVPALDDNKRALLDLLRRDREPDAEIFLQPAADKITNFRSLDFHEYLLFLKTPGGRDHHALASVGHAFSVTYMAGYKPALLK
jgi:hypothetical protein